MDLGRFDIKNWYHALIVIGLIAASGGAAFDLKNISGKDAILLGIGLIAVGIGEWMNHPFQTRFVRTPVGPGTASGHTRLNCPAGVGLVVVGTALILLAAVRFALTL